MPSASVPGGGRGEAMSVVPVGVGGGVPGGDVRPSHRHWAGVAGESGGLVGQADSNAGRGRAGLGAVPVRGRDWPARGLASQGGSLRAAAWLSSLRPSVFAGVTGQPGGLAGHLPAAQAARGTPPGRAAVVRVCCASAASLGELARERFLRGPPELSLRAKLWPSALAGKCLADTAACRTKAALTDRRRRRGGHGQCQAMASSAGAVSGAEPACVESSRWCRPGRWPPTGPAPDGPPLRSAEVERPRLLRQLRLRAEAGHSSAAERHRHSPAGGVWVTSRVTPASPSQSTITGPTPLPIFVVSLAVALKASGFASTILTSLRTWWPG